MSGFVGSHNSKSGFSGDKSINLLPKSRPARPRSGQIYYHSVTNVVLIYNGSSWESLGAVSSGGIVTSYTASGTTYIVHTFLTSGIFTKAATGDVDYLLVAGGGAGGAGQAGGGGGAGGLRTGTGLEIAGGDHNITIGAGGVGAAGGSAVNFFGGMGFGRDSNIAGLIAAKGGGMAGTGNSGDGQAGGSAGGGSYGGGTAGTAFDSGAQGNNGGTGGSGTGNNYGGAGGGGAGAVGGNGSDGAAGAGGVGSDNAYRTGSNIKYAGGGGGANYGGSLGAGGDGGGGNGTTGATNPSLLNHGSDNTGGGGGGQNRAATGSGGNGGSGICVLRYPL